MAAQGIPHASIAENAVFTIVHTIPGLARGAFIGNKAGVKAITAADATRRSAEFARRLRARHGGRSVIVTGLTGPMLVVLNSEDARRVLSGSDDVYSLDSPEKDRGLGIFQPNSLILSRGDVRHDRRRFNEYVLGFGRADHPHGEALRRIVREELAVTAEEVKGTDLRLLERRHINALVNRAVMRFLFGDGARGDEITGDILRELRREANVMGVRFWRRRRNERLVDLLYTRLRRYVGRGEGLMAMFPSAPQSDRTDPVGQITHWMLALDIVSMCITQTLALLGSHPHHEAAAAARGRDYVAACAWEGVRLWPPVGNIMRVTTEPVEWYGGTLPAGHNVLLPSIILHRDEEMIPYANRFAPEVWMNGTAEQEWLIAPFSRGPGTCAGRDLALVLCTEVLSEMLARWRFATLRPDLDPARPLPYTIDPTSARYAVHDAPRITPRHGQPIETDNAASS